MYCLVFVALVQVWMKYFGYLKLLAWHLKGNKVFNLERALDKYITFIMTHVYLRSLHFLVAAQWRLKMIY